MNNKPSWDDAPEWAKYLAMDEDGDWFFYEKKPKISSQKRSWICEDGLFSWAGDTVDWQQTLEERPQ